MKTYIIFTDLYQYKIKAENKIDALKKYLTHPYCFASNEDFKLIIRIAEVLGFIEAITVIHWADREEFILYIIDETNNFVEYGSVDDFKTYAEYKEHFVSRLVSDIKE